MKKKLFGLLLALCMFISLLPTSSWAADSTGTEECTHFISDLAELEMFRDYINSGNTGAGEYFVLTADIDMSEKYSETTGVSWEMIGDVDLFEGTYDNPFQGTFDGGGHTISGLYINKTGPGGAFGFDSGALFGVIDGGTVKNLNVKGYVSVAADGGEAAGIAGAVWNGAITDCSFDGVVECPNYVAVGIVAGCNESVISGCKTSGRVTGYHLVGGIVGTGDGTIINCINESEIIGTAVAGGIAGFWSGKIEDCVNRGSVTGKPLPSAGFTVEESEEYGISTSFAIGGIVGIADIAIIGDCCNLGAVSGNTEVGGIVGNSRYYLDGDTVELLTRMKNCFNVGPVASTLETEGEHYIGSIIGTVADIWNDEGPLLGLADVSNCYYLIGTAEKGIGICGDSMDATTAKTADEFASGAVAYLLQEANGGNTSPIVWGQRLTTDKTPVLMDEAEMTVYKVTFVTDETEYTVNYANSGVPVTKPTAPTKSGYTFEGWYKESACTNPWSFTADTVTADMTLYAKWMPKSETTTPSRPDSSSSTSNKPSVAIDGKGGTVTADRNGTVIITPDKGYEIDKITVNSEEITVPKDGKLTGLKRTDKVVVTFKEIPEVPGSAVDQFTDVKPGAWYYEAVKYAVGNSLFQGTGENTFGPNDTLTRGMLVTVLYRLEKEPETNNNKLFNDVAANAWYADAVTWGATKGVVEGYGNGIFGPDDSITRAQLAVMLWRYAGEPASNGSLNAFADSDEVGGWATAALRWAVDNGIIMGRGKGVLDPAGKATRAEAAAMLVRYLENDK